MPDPTHPVPEPPSRQPSQSSLTQLVERIARIESTQREVADAVARLGGTSESLRTRELIVVDEHGQERITLRCKAGASIVEVVAPGTNAHKPITAVLMADVESYEPTAGVYVTAGDDELDDRVAELEQRIESLTDFVTGFVERAVTAGALLAGQRPLYPPGSGLAEATADRRGAAAQAALDELDGTRRR